MQVLVSGTRGNVPDSRYSCETFLPALKCGIFPRSSNALGAARDYFVKAHAREACQDRRDGQPQLAGSAQTKTRPIFNVCMVQVLLPAFGTV